MADLATAYLRLIPSLKGSQKQIESELSGINTRAAGDKAGMDYGGGIKGGIKSVAIGGFLANTLTAAVDKAAALAADTFSSAFNNYADFEQLEGGVEKIFDQANTDQIFQDAQNAYKELNMSANEYLDSINQVGATFAQTMGDQKGYDTARAGMLSIADYASGTGRNLNELNDKYKLITRSAASYQSIADQFAGILPQTSGDFLSQAQAAGLLAGEYEKLTDVPVAEYQQAVTTMLQKGVANLGLAQNAMNESTSTLSGSIAMAQSAWQNLLTEMGKPDGNIDAAVNNVVTSIEAVLANAMPVIERILSAMGEAIGNFAMQAGEYFMEHRTEIYDKVGEFIRGALEAIVTAIPYIVEGIAYLIASLLEYVVTHIPDMLQAAGELMIAFAQAIADALTPSMTAAEELVNGILDAIGGFFKDMFDAGANLIQGFIDGILSMPGRVADAIGNAVGGAIDQGKRMLGIASPSKVFREIGNYTMLGLEAGINDEIPAVSRAMTRVNGVLTAQSSTSSTSPRMLPGGTKVIGGSGSGRNEATAAQMLTVILELNKTQFGRMVYQLNGEETQRVGVNLAGGFA